MEKFSGLKLSALLLLFGLLFVSCARKNADLIDRYDRATKEFVAAVINNDEKRAQELGQEIGESVKELRERKLSLREQTDVIRITQQFYTDLANIDYTKLDYSQWLAPMDIDMEKVEELESNEDVSRIRDAVTDSLKNISIDDISIDDIRKKFNF